MKIIPVICEVGYVLALATPVVAAPTVPTFLARHDYSLFSFYVQVADTNGDGIPDLIANDSGGIEVLLGNGDGTFGPSGANTSTITDDNIRFIATDFSGDGKADLVIVGGLHGIAPTGIAICLGKGDGSFDGGTFYQVGSGQGIGGVVVGDFNGDGIPDVATTSGEGLWLFTGSGGGGLNAGVLLKSLTGAGDVAVADFNGDHKLDLVVTLPYSGAAGGGFLVMMGNGDGTFQSPQTFSKPSKPTALATGILTKGGHPGIAICCAYGTTDVYLYFGNGSGGFAGPSAVNLPDPTGIAIGDLNGDGVPDIVSAGGEILFGTSAGSFAPIVSYPVVDLLNNFFNVLLVDLRNHGLLDIVTDNYYGVSVLLNAGKGKMEDGQLTAVSGGTGCGVTADFNRDHKPDLAINTPTGITILKGTGKASAPFTTGANLALAGASCPVLGDINNDGIPDLLIPANNPNAVYAYLGNGDGTFRLGGSTSTPQSGGSVVLVDINHDGNLDFVTSGNLLALGNGDGTFQIPVPLVSTPPTSGFSAIAAGDINNDGWPDLVLTSYSYTNVTVLLNDQHGGFTQVPTNFGGLTWQAVLADLNGDGNLDLIIAPAAQVYLGDGKGNFTLDVALGGPWGATNIFDAVADLNGDGVPDIMVMGGTSLTVYIGTGSGTYAAPFDLGLGRSPGQVFVANVHGQRPSAGLPDIVSPDSSAGVVTLLNTTR